MAVDRSKPVTIQNLINRINQFSKWAVTQPDRKGHWEAKIEETKVLIVKAVLEHDGHSVFENIYLKDTVFKKLRFMDSEYFYRYWVRDTWLQIQDKNVLSDPEAIFNKAMNDPNSGFCIDSFIEAKNIQKIREAHNNK